MKKSTTLNYMVSLVILVAALALAGCSSTTQPVSAGVQPEVINNPDTFEFQVSSVENYTGVWRYDWQMSGTVVNIDQSSAVTGGTVTLRVLDADGQEVYAGNLAAGGSHSSTTGVAGTWTLEVSLVGGSGTLNFRTEKKL